MSVDMAEPRKLATLYCLHQELVTFGKDFDLLQYALVCLANIIV